MGIDAYDLSFRLEKRFEISFDRDDLIYLFQSPRQVIRLVTARLSGEILPIPDVPAMFERITSAIQSVPDYRRRWFRHTLEASFPKERRELNWSAFGDALGVTLPALPASESEVPELPRECSSHVRLTFWLMEHAPERVLWKRSPAECVGQTPVGHDWEPEQIQQAVVETIVDVLGVDIDEATLDADMVEALGME